jgi:hypothetical protein
VAKPVRHLGLFLDRILFLLFIAQNIPKLSTYELLNFLGFLRQFSIYLMIFVVEATNSLLIVLLLNQPKELLVELSEFFEDCSFSGIVLVVLGDLRGAVEDSHDELGVVLNLIEQDLLLFGVRLIQFEEIGYLDVISEGKLIFLVVDPVNVVDDFSHARCSP